MDPKTHEYTFTIDQLAVSPETEKAIAKAVTDLLAKKPFIMLPKGVSMQTMPLESRSTASVKEPEATVEPVPGARRIELE